MTAQVIMPQLGESVIEGTVAEWLKKEGETIDEMESLLVVESDKVTTEIPSPAGGTVLKIIVPSGETVKSGTLLAVIGQPGEAIPDIPEAVPAHGEASTTHEEIVAVPMSEPPTEPVPVPAQPATDKGSNGSITRISPVVANIAAYHGVDLNLVQGTGRGGRITKKDILAYVESKGAPAPAAAGQADVPPWEQPGSGDLFKPADDFYQQAEAVATPAEHTHEAPPVPGKPGRLIPHSTMRKRIAEHMVQSKLKTAPHVTTVFEVDMSAVVAHREANKAELAARDINLTYTAYFVAAAAHALRTHPMINSQWMEEGILLHSDINIGVAVALDEGLIVPVVKHTDELSLAGLARQINDLSARARNNQLKPDEVAGGTLTITNHGVSGSLFATPIIVQPQTGILGVGAIQRRVVVLDGDVMAIRPMIYLTLTFDHRVLDGAGADWFMAEIKKTLEGWQRT